MESCWALPAWISPGAALFVVFNVLVGAVAVMSRGQQGGRGRRLCRSASSMVLDRLRSFSMFSVHPEAEWYHHTSPDGEHAVPEPPSAPAATTPAADAAALMPESEEDGAEAEEKDIGLDEANVRGQQRHAPQSSPLPAAAEAIAAVERPGTKEPAKVAPEIIKRRARASGRRAEETPEGKAELNARADRFIVQFREELKLQRLNSIINYTRRLRRGAGAALALS